MIIISMMINDCLFDMLYDSLLGSRAVSIGRKSDRNGSETQSKSREEQGKYTRVKKESVRNESSYTSLTVGVLCPAQLSFEEPYRVIID